MGNNNRDVRIFTFFPPVYEKDEYKTVVSQKLILKPLGRSFANVLRHIQYLQQLVYIKNLALKLGHKSQGSRFHCLANAMAMTFCSLSLICTPCLIL